MRSSLPQTVLAFAAALTCLAAAPSPADAQAALSPARATLGIARAERAAELEPVLSDRAAALTAWMGRAGEATGRALAATQRADEVMPVVARGTDRRSVALLLLPRDGELDARQAEALERLMRCRRTGRTHEVSPGLAAILADLAEAFPGRAIEFVSGYRPPPHGAPNSKHFHGNALDVRIPGVPLEDLRDYLWTAQTSIGLGYYPRQGFVHIDYRPGDPDIAWTAIREGAPYHYNPAWARALRPDEVPPSRVGL